MSLVSESPGNISPGIVFVKFPGPGKSWKSKCKVLESDADAMTQAAGAKKTSELLPAVTCIYGPSCVNDCKRCSNSFFAIPSQHVTVMNIYSDTDAICVPKK